MQCANNYTSCDDSNPCTYDWCDPDLGCANVVISNCDAACASQAACGDGNLCTQDLCQDNGAGGGKCVHNLVTCDDFDSCTNDFCDPQTGCGHAPIPNCGLTCSVDFECASVTDACGTGKCSPVSKTCVAEPKICNDGNPCTVDFCVPEQPGAGCKAIAAPGCGVTPCTTTADCTGPVPLGSECVKNACVNNVCTFAGNACDDGDFCTNDGCSPDGISCFHEPNTQCQ
jgi:hypothetical protein